MKTAELKKKKDAELIKLARELQESLREFRFGVSGGATNSTSKATSLRKDIARIKTELTARERVS